MSIPLKYNVRNLVVRKGGSLMTVAGFMLVVAIFIVVMAMVNGMESSLVASGSPDNVIALGKGAKSETGSKIAQHEEIVQIIRNYPEIALNAKREQMVSIENLAGFSIKLANGEFHGMSVRGVKPPAFEVHERVKLVKGRVPAAGAWEIMVGAALERELPLLSLGNKVSFAEHDWDIVGVFQADGASFESEVWTSLEIMWTARGLWDVTSLVMKVGKSAKPEDLVRRIVDDEKRINLQAAAEPVYYAEQNVAAEGMKTVGYVIAAIMALGAVFGAMNTMYASIGERIKEIGTLRALGFSRGAILFSFMLESIVMGGVGGVAGCLVALAMNGYSMSFTGERFTAVAFQFNVSYETMGIGMVFAVVMGILGGLLPAATAARLPIIRSLREI